MRKDYGERPNDLGLIDLNPDEMMAWLYCPIKMAGLIREMVPDNLVQFMPILDAVHADTVNTIWKDSYVYLTAKTLWVTEDSPGNRPGWHSDGFMTEDVNYIWSDRNPTLFWIAEKPQAFTQDHTKAMAEMADVAERTGYQDCYADRHLLRLDERHIHRVGNNFTAGMRTFVKVSLSKHKYSHVGNSINHSLPQFPRPSVQRAVERNCPATT
jgi:hypothetical protein